MGRGDRKRLSGLLLLIDKTTYEDAHNSNPVKCAIMITEPQTGDIHSLPRIRLSEELVQAGPQTIAEHIRKEMSARIGFALNDLVFEEEFTESARTILVFVGMVAFTVATDSIYSSVTAKSLSELRFLLGVGRVSKLHYEIAKRYLVE